MGSGQSVSHEPSPYSSLTSTTAPKISKSVLRRSRSIRSEVDTIGPSAQGMRYIPRMATSHSGLVIPTKPFGTKAANTGMESPQLGYGFYTNLTPPALEMYHSHASKVNHSESNSSSSSAGMEAMTRPQHNQVFQNLQNNKTPMGWSSVPI